VGSYNTLVGREIIKLVAEVVEGDESSGSITEFLTFTTVTQVNGA
jgi:hypothetical protein